MQYINKLPYSNGTKVDSASLLNNPLTDSLMEI